MSSDDTVAMVLDRDVARRVLAGECLDRRALHVLQTPEPIDSDVMLILKRGSAADGQAIADALVLALGILPRTMVIDADATLPEGFTFDRFVEVGEAPHFRSKRGQLVNEIIPPVKFC